MNNTPKSNRNKYPGNLYACQVPQYAKFRNAIYSNLLKNNTEDEHATLQKNRILYKKSQLLLHRFIFILFAEGRGLLPPNSISEIVKQWKTIKEEHGGCVPLYDRFKKYFECIYSGCTGPNYDIFAFGGELFQPDEILDTIIIDDDVLLKNLQFLREHNATSENVAEGYLPPSHTALQLCCDKKRTRLSAERYHNWLLNITILHAPCGSGESLIYTLGFLMNEHREVDELRRQLSQATVSHSDLTSHILEKNIFGADTNEETVEAVKLNIWMHTAQIGRKLNALGNNIKHLMQWHGDTKGSVDNTDVWYKAFPKVFRKKSKKAWHITTATHNSRYSKRIHAYRIQRDKAVWLSPKEEVIVSETIADIVAEDEINIIAYNVCGDHVHILLVCTREERDGIIQKIKAKSARACNIAMGRTTTWEHAPMHCGGEHALRCGGRGKTQHHLWTQKYAKKLITSEQQMQNTIRYIQNNRVKHGLVKGASSLDSGTAAAHEEKLKEISKKITCTREHAFRTKYIGGFDVIIGGAPYVQLDKIKK